MVSRMDYIKSELKKAMELHSEGLISDEDLKEQKKMILETPADFGLASEQGGDSYERPPAQMNPVAVATPPAAAAPSSNQNGRTPAIASAAAAPAAPLPLRPYQQRIVDEVHTAGGDALVLLPTGAGKTRIATELISRVGTPCLFIVSTRPLAEQQAVRIRQDLPGVRVCELCGDSSLPSSGEADVIVATAEKANNELSLSDRDVGVENIRRFRIVVFDEAHHCLKNNPYGNIADACNRAREDGGPRPFVMGLTAQPTFKREDLDIWKALDELVTKMQVTKVCRAENAELRDGGYAKGWPGRPQIVDRFKGAVDEDWREESDKLLQHFIQDADRYSHCELVAATKAIEDALQNAGSFSRRFIGEFVSGGCNEGSATKWADEAHAAGTSAGKILAHWYSAIHLAVVGPLGSLDVAEAYLSLPMARTDDPMHTATPLQQTIDLLRTIPQAGGVLLAVRSYASGLAGRGNVCEWERFQHIISNLQKAESELNAASTERRKLHGIVFVRQRLAAEVFCRVLRQSPQIDFACECVYSTGSRASPALRISPTELKQRLDAFRSGAVQLLVSTSVLEEGIDVPEANVVVHVDPIQNSAQFVQAAGRARTADAIVAVLHGDVDIFKIAVDITHEMLLRVVQEKNEKDQAFTDHGHVTPTTPFDQIPKGSINFASIRTGSTTATSTASPASPYAARPGSFGAGSEAASPASPYAARPVATASSPASPYGTLSVATATSPPSSANVVAAERCLAVHQALQRVGVGKTPTTLIHELSQKGSVTFSFTKRDKIDQTKFVVELTYSVGPGTPSRTVTATAQTKKAAEHACADWVLVHCFQYPPFQ